MVPVKICGLTTDAAVDAAVNAGAAYLGFVLVANSPRATSLASAASLSARAPAGRCRVALLVDPDDGDLDAVAGSGAFDMIQLHGDETPDRVREVRSRCGAPVMKAVAIGEAADVVAARRHEAAADMLLFDAPRRAPDAPRGGSGHAFDWSLLAGQRWSTPWMLAGGLTADSVAPAVRATGARALDVSSGVERARGVKDVEKIRTFVAAARAAFAQAHA